MGNCQCQLSEAATILVQHPDNKQIERLYFSLNANQVMSSNPGHYVALVTTTRSESGAAVKHLKLLRPNDMLQIGQVYRLISFEDVLKEFNAKKSSKLGRLLNESEGSDRGAKVNPEENHTSNILPDGQETSSYSETMIGRRMSSRQWRPALHSISEVGS